MSNSMLRQVLQAFEDADHPRTVAQLARELDIAPGLLDGMLAYWVRKGRLRESRSTPACTTCGGAAGCPFVPNLPRSYELVTGDDPPGPSACGCSG